MAAARGRVQWGTTGERRSAYDVDGGCAVCGTSVASPDTVAQPVEAGGLGV